ncbi:MAG: glycosyltransferase [Tetrasphaera sp.]|nr:glycosyltransferase [Tetrasphaera sp.]
MCGRRGHHLLPPRLRAHLPRAPERPDPPGGQTSSSSTPRRTPAPPAVAGFPSVRYLQSDAGPGTMATSRAMALAATACDVLVFLDDDAYADPDWLEHLLVPYADPAVAAVGGRPATVSLGGDRGLDQIGLLLPDGRLPGFSPPTLGVTSMWTTSSGANMSIRRRGARPGWHPGLPRTCLRESRTCSCGCGRPDIGSSRPSGRSHPRRALRPQGAGSTCGTTTTATATTWSVVLHARDGRSPDPALRGGRPARRCRRGAAGESAGAY